MSEKIRKVGSVGYLGGIVPPDYHCDHCNIHGVKLWHEFSKLIETKLLCAHCVAIEEKELFVHLAKSFPEQVISIGKFVRAIPVEDSDMFCSWNSAGEAGTAWWKRLPTTLPNYEVFDLAEFEEAINLGAFGITLKPILKAVTVAKELDLKFMPSAWIAYIQSGWRIADHLDNYIWLRPLRSGSMSVEGLVKDIDLDIKRLLDTKMDLGTDIGKVLRSHYPSKQDVGKIFYIQSELAFNEKNGKIVSRENFLKLDPIDVRGWVEVGEFDVVDMD
jgi:hypothetical protein